MRNFFRGCALGVALLLGATLFALAIEFLKAAHPALAVAFISALVVGFFGWLNWKYPL